MRKGQRRAPLELALMLIGCGLAVVNVGLGASLFFGLPTRTAAASFDTIRNLASIRVWGILFMAAGLSALASQFFWRLVYVACAHAASGFMCAVWCVAFTLGLTNPNASASGIWAYLGLALVHAVVAATSYAERSWGRGA